MSEDWFCMQYESEEQRQKSLLIEEALALETSCRNWSSKRCYFIHLLLWREGVWSCRCCNFTFKWKNIEKAVYSISPLGRSASRCMFNCHHRWPLKTEYSAVSFCHLLSMYLPRAKQQQELCLLSFVSNYKLLQRNVYRERTCFQSLALWNGFGITFIYKGIGRGIGKIPFSSHSILCLFLVRPDLYLPIANWVINPFVYFDHFPDLSSVLYCRCL